MFITVLWFLLILLFLVISTSLCVYRNSPLMVKEWRSFKEQATEKSLLAFSHLAQFETKIASSNETKDKLIGYLQDKGFKYQIRQQSDGSELIAAKSGTHQRLGYIFTTI